MYVHHLHIFSITSFILQGNFITFLEKKAMNRRLEIPAPKEELVVVERELPEAPAGGAIVKIHYAGICHSDLHLLDDDMNVGEGRKYVCSENLHLKYPVVLGHEISGEIHSFGKDVDPDKLAVQVGDLVMVYPWGGCRNCKACRDGNLTRCPKVLEKCLGLHLPGGFEEYVEVPLVDSLIPVPDGVPMDVASLIPCSGITAYNAICKVLPSVQDYADIFGESTLLIVGAGGLGLWGIQVAKELMPPGTRIIVAEAFESKFEDARKAGADDTVLWPLDGTVKDNVAACKKLAPGGVAGAVDFVGAGNTADSIFGCLASTAVMVVIGMLGGEMKLPLPFLIWQQNTVRGSLCGDPKHVQQIAQLVAQKKVSPPPITHVKLAETNRVMDDMRAGTTRGRNIIKHIQ